MTEPISRSLVVHGASILLGFIAMGWLLGNYAVRVKKLDRTVVVKGLSEREATEFRRRGVGEGETKRYGGE